MIASSASPGSTSAAPSRTASETVGVRWCELSGMALRLTQDHLGVAPRSLGDRAAHVALGRRVGGFDHPPRDQLLEHDRHLLLGERGTEATAHAAAEGDPGVGAGRGLEEALWPEAIGLRVDRRVAVDEVDARHYRHA